MTNRLAAVFAHPDDDTHGDGGILAMEAGRVEYTLVVASSGEAGEIADPALASPETLGKVREEEELESLRILGVPNAAVHFLRYPDGHVADVPREELVDKITEILARAKPHVVITFGPEGVTSTPTTSLWGRRPPKPSTDSSRKPTAGRSSGCCTSPFPSRSWTGSGVC